MTKVASIAKEFHRLMKRIGRLTDGQASIHDVEWDDITLGKFQVVIKPNSGYYKGCVIKFEIRNLESYQDGKPPTVFCRTNIYHPNIDPNDDDFDDNSNVCLNILEEGTWVPSLGLEGLILGLIFLLNNPNIEDALSPYFDSCNVEDFEENIQKYVAGEEIDGVKFDNGMAELTDKDGDGPVSENDFSGEIRKETKEEIKVQEIKEENKFDDKGLQKNVDDTELIDEKKNENVNKEDTDQKELDDDDYDEDDEDDGAMLELVSFEGEIMLATNVLHIDTEATKIDEHAGNEDVINTLSNIDDANDSVGMVTEEDYLEKQIPGACNFDKGEKTFEKFKRKFQERFSEKRNVKLTVLTTFGLLCTYICGRCIVKR